jgi:hypothetical protein
MPNELNKRTRAQQERIYEILAANPGMSHADAIAQYQAESTPSVAVEDRTTGGDPVVIGEAHDSPEAEDAALRQLPEAPEQAGGQQNMRLLELLGNIGTSFAQNRAVGKANEQTAGRQANANLINTLRGSPTASVTPAQPKEGVLGTLSRALGGAGTAIRESREAEVAGEQVGFKNEMALGAAGRAEEGLELDQFTAETSRLKAENAGGVKVTERRAAYRAKGGGLYDDNPSMQVEDIEAAIENDPQYQEDVASSPRLAAELKGIAVEGYRSREKNVLGQGKADDQASRAEDRMDREAAAISIKGYEASLRGRVLTKVFGNGKEMDQHRKGFLSARISQMPQEYQDYAVGLHIEWAGKYHELAFDKAEADRATEKAGWEREFATQKEVFDVEEILRDAVQDLPGVKAFSGQQGIGGSFQRLDQAYQKYSRDRAVGRGDRATMQVALINQFQRLIDPATVREGDIALIREAESSWARLNAKVEGFMEGGFVADATIDGMYEMAIELEAAHRRFVMQEVSGAIKVWNTIHTSNPVDQQSMDAIVTSILGGDRDEEEVEIDIPGLGE